MTNDRDRARNTLSASITFGAFVVIIGATIAGLNWPSTEVTGFGEATETGNGVVTVAGLMFSWAGGMLTLLGVIGYGVALGREASPGAT